MESLETWMRSIVLCALFLSLAQLLIPKGAIARIGTFAGGLLLMLSLLHPLLRLPELALPAFYDLEGELSVRQQELTQETQAALAERIAADTEAYICGVAQDLGLTLSVSVKTEAGEGGVMFPVAADLTGSYSQALALRLENDLGIPPERQVWHEG